MLKIVNNIEIIAPIINIIAIQLRFVISFFGKLHNPVVNIIIPK